MSVSIKIAAVWALSYIAFAFINLEPYWAIIDHMDYTALRALWVLLCSGVSIGLWLGRGL